MASLIIQSVQKAVHLSANDYDKEVPRRTMSIAALYAREDCVKKVSTQEVRSGLL